MVFLFFIIALGSVSLAYLLRGYFSGENLKLRYSLVCLVFNSAVGFFYLELAKQKCISFYGCFPGFIDKHPVVFWVALACLFLHAFAFPVNVKVKRWIFRTPNKFSIK